MACEYVAASRKLSPFGLTVAGALENVQTLRRIWTSCGPSWDALDEAERLLGEKLYTEDFSGYAAIGEVAIVDPFRAAP